MIRSVGFLGIVLLMTIQAFAQQPTTIQRGQRGYVTPMQIDNSAYITVKEPMEEAKRVLAKCTSSFGLDDFQQEILKGMLVKRYEDENAILMDEDNNKDMRIKKISEREKLFHRELSSILTTDQVEQFKDMDFTETKEDKKRKKKRKRRNKDSD